MRKLSMVSTNFLATYPNGVGAVRKDGNHPFLRLKVGCRKEDLFLPSPAFLHPMPKSGKRFGTHSEGPHSTGDLDIPSIFTVR